MTRRGDRDDPARHHDDSVPLARFTDRVLVVCPRCGGRALVVPRPGLPAPRYAMELLYQPRRLACAGCGAVGDWTADMRRNALVGAEPGGIEDPFFRRPLWLRTRCAGHVLWAYDETHVDALAAYVGARLRERGSLSPTLAMFARLPAWMKTSEHRPEILTGLKTLRDLAGRGTPYQRPVTKALCPIGPFMGHHGQEGHRRGKLIHPWSREAS